MKNNKRVMSIALASALMLSSFTTVLAADRDLIHKETNEAKIFEEYVFDNNFLGELIFDGEMENYYVEIGEKHYNLAEVQAKFDEDATITLEEAIEGLDSVDGEEPGEELKVVEVSAINGQELVAGDNNQKLGFVINGDESVTLKQVTDAGYTVEFLATSAVLDDGTGTGVGDGSAVTKNATGLLNTATLTNGTTFKYTVTISKEGQEDITSGAPANVTVKTVNKAQITKITDVALVTLGADNTTGDTDALWKNDFITTDFNTGNVNSVVVVPTEGTNALGTVVKPGTGKTNLTGLVASSAKVTYESSKPTVALVNSTTGVVNPLSAGTTTITVKVNGEVAKTIPVVVKAKQTPTALKENTKTIPKDTNPQTVNLTVVDEDGKDVRVDYGTYTAEVVGANKADITVASAITDSTATLPLVVTKADKAGTYTVNIKLGTEVIDTLTLNVAEVPAEADKYEITKDTDNSTITEAIKFDLVDGGDQSLAVAYQGYDSSSNLKVGGKQTLSGGEFTLVSSDTDVVTINADNKTIDAKGVGTAQVKLVQAGYVWDTVTVEVANTTAQITGIALKSGKDKIEVAGDVSANASVIADIFDELVVTFDNETAELHKDTTLSLNEIASIVESNGNINTFNNLGDKTAATAVTAEVVGDQEGTLVITVSDVYGGGSYAFPVVVTDETAPTATVDGDATNDATTFTITPSETAVVAITSQSITTETASVSGNVFTVTNTGATAADTITFTVTDQAGNISTYKATITGTTWAIALQS